MWAGDSIGCGHLILFDVGSIFRFTVITAHMQRNGVCGGTARAALVIPSRCFPEDKGQHVARKSVTDEKNARSPTASL
jgi:hypothetical protein